MIKSKSCSPAVICAVVALGILWWRLIDHLRIEWAVNAQYSYGWAVPVLCVYLLWQRGALGRFELARPFRVHGGLPQDGPTLDGSRKFVGPGAVVSVLVALLALLYFPTRLIEEANPEWRLVSWALAFEVIGLTSWLLFMLPRGPAVDTKPTQSADVTREGRKSEGRNPRSEIRKKAEAASGPRWISPMRPCINQGFPWFPLLFFLVAVPWPTVIEGSIIRGLTRANTAVTVELVNAAGLPAIQHGNVIEVGQGAVGIDEACSGIQSFQAALMVALFFGGLFRLTARRHVALCVVSLVLAFVFNVARTTLLTWAAATKGPGALSSWHNVTGVTMLLACFFTVWWMAVAMRRSCLEIRRPKSEIRDSKEGRNPNDAGKHGARRQDAGAPRCKDAVERVRTGRLGSKVDFPKAALPGKPWPQASAVLAGWLIISEAGTEAWYRSRERALPPAITWKVSFPRDDSTFHELPFSEKTRQFLRFDEGMNAGWEIAPGRSAQLIFLRWKPGRTAVHLAKTHTPESCVTAAGREMVSKSEVCYFRTGNLRLPFRSYVFKAQKGFLWVYYCLWEDRGSNFSEAATGFDSVLLTYENRLKPVMKGRRLTGERSLEIALWGFASEEEAEAAARDLVEGLVCKE